MHNKGTMNYSLPIELSHKGPGKGNKLLLVKWEVGKKMGGNVENGDIIMLIITVIHNFPLEHFMIYSYDY